MQRHRWAIDVIWFFHAHLCPVGPRVLDTCSLIFRTIHIWEALWTPWARAWFISISRGHKLVWGFITILYLCHALLLYLKLCVEHLYYFGSRHDFAVSTSPVTLSGSQSFTAIGAKLGSVSESANFVAGSLMGWPPEIFLNPVCCYLCTPAG